MPENPALKGLIFSIDRFVAEDGPGIRTTVFLKGCPLKCVWCHSPQSQAAEPQIAFYENRCIDCRMCVQACPQNAQIASAAGRQVLWEQCDNCGKCAEVCPSRALEMVGEWLTVEQVIRVVEKDLVCYRNSGGGVTFSGGEPAAQPEFLAACLKACQDIEIHTALDTTGLAKWSFYEKILPSVDLFLYDIKHADRKKHKQFTGVDNELIFGNLKKLSRRGKRIWVRIPLIPGYNDSKKNLLQIAEFVSPLKSVEKVSLLPYNMAAGAKYSFVGKRYELEHLDSHLKEPVRGFASIFSRFDIKAEIDR